MRNYRLPAVVVLLAFVAACAHAAELPAASLDAGYRDLYNLQFEAAHRVFHDWENSHPGDPMGPVSDAAAYLFSEFERLHILEPEFFTNDRNFEDQKKLHPDPQAKEGFEAQLTRAKQLADAVLARDAHNGDALFANVLVLGLRGDYAALIEKRNGAGLSYIKQARTLAEQLLAEHPSYYDAYLAVGVENYLLSLKPAPLRWLLRLGGAQTNRAMGLEKLRITAEKGRYLMPYARLLLAVAALRDKDRVRARALLEDLAREFPHNRLYAREITLLRQGASD